MSDQEQNLKAGYSANPKAGAIGIWSSPNGAAQYPSMNRLNPA